MNAVQRREVILERLSNADAPVSASVMAAELGVSRQIVVGDVALLRAGGAAIEATPRGYQFHPAPGGYTGILACVHRTAEEMRTELYAVVDQGGTVVDVAVENPLYGELRGNLTLSARRRKRGAGGLRLFGQSVRPDAHGTRRAGRTGQLRRRSGGCAPGSPTSGGGKPALRCL